MSADISFEADVCRQIFPASKWGNMEILNCIGSLSKFHTRFKVAPQHHFWCSFSVFRFLPICNRTIMAKLLYFLSILSLAASVTSQTCPLQFDGRVPNAATLASFNTSASLFNPSYVFGQSKDMYSPYWGRSWRIQTWNGAKFFYSLPSLLHL